MASVTRVVGVIGATLIMTFARPVAWLMHWTPREKA